MSESKKKKANSALSKFLTALLIVIIAISGFQIVKIALKYHRDQATYRELSQYAEEDGIDWEKLRKINPDVIAWIRIPDTKIDYPIVSAPDNDKYLHTKFNGEAGGAGTLFVDANTKEPFNQLTTIVYGHHMKDGSMFNNLKKFMDRDFYMDHQTYELFTPEQNYTVDIIEAYNTPAFSDIYKTDFTTQEEIDKYIEYLNDNADEIFKSDNAEAGDHLVLLSTCAYEYKNARYVVAGKLIPKN